MKSRYLVLVPIILLALLLIPIILVRNEFVKKTRDMNVPATTDASMPPSDGSVKVGGFPISPQEEIPLPGYTTAPPSRDGIGKIFMGREISRVMGHPGIGWLERSDREKEEAPSKAIALLDLAPNTVIADIGAGSGYYSFRIAPLIPKGQVIAVDIQPQMLRFIRDEAEKLSITNVHPHLGTVESVEIPANALDAALMVDAYHEFSHPAEMLQSLHKALKPGGKIYLLEYRAEDPEVPIKPLHKMTAAQARKEFEALGFTFLENKPGLPWQHFLVFGKSQSLNSSSQTSENVLKRLETIRIPKVHLEDATIEEAFDLVLQRTEELDGTAIERRGISLVIRRPRGAAAQEEPDSPLLGDPTIDSKKITLNLNDVSAREALAAVGKKGALDIYLTPYAILVTPAGALSSPASDPDILATIYRHKTKSGPSTDH